MNSGYEDTMSKQSGRCVRPRSRMRRVCTGTLVSYEHTFRAPRQALPSRSAGFTAEPTTRALQSISDCLIIVY